MRHIEKVRPRNRDLYVGPGTRDTPPGTLHLAPGTRDLYMGLGTWDPPYGTIHLGSGTLYVGTRTQYLYV